MHSDPLRRAAESRKTARVALADMRKRAGMLVALALALPGLWFVVDATRRASYATLGRDQGIFQYIAWAVRQGDVLYRDIRDVNGPVITMVHIVFQWLGGEDEHRFRVLDLVVSGLAYAIAGALIANKAWIGERFAWALGAWTALSAQYLVYGFWDTAQRESFIGWFVVVSIALGYATESVRSRSGMIAVALAGALSFVPWLAKPTFALVTVVQMLAFAFESDRKRRLALFAAGGAVGLLFPLFFMLIHADIGAWMTITFHDVPAMYRFIWPRPASVILGLPGYAQTIAIAVATTLGTLGLIVYRVLPRRALPIALLPVIGIVSMLIQAKGFPYHFHLITLGTTFAWLTAAAALRDRWPIVAFVGALVVGVHAARIIRVSAYPDVPAHGQIDDPTYLANFNRVDYFPAQMREAAALVRAKTKPSDRVQTYGMDAYVLFLARRLSATPYIYAYDLNMDWALRGAYDEGGIHPTEAQQEVIRAMRTAHRQDFDARIRSQPPAAFILVSLSPLMSSQDALEDFATQCPDTEWAMREYYTDLGGHPTDVWLRSETAPPRFPLEMP